MGARFWRGGIVGVRLAIEELKGRKFVWELNSRKVRGIQQTKCGYVTACELPRCD